MGRKASPGQEISGRLTATARPSSTAFTYTFAAVRGSMVRPPVSAFLSAFVGWRSVDARTGGSRRRAAAGESVFAQACGAQRVTDCRHQFHAVRVAAQVVEHGAVVGVTACV